MRVLPSNTRTFSSPPQRNSVMSHFPPLQASGHNWSPFLLHVFCFMQMESYKIWVFCMTSPSQPSALKALPWCNMYWDLTHFHGKIIQCMDIYSILFIHSLVKQHLACFHTLVIVNNAAVNVECRYLFNYCKLYKDGRYYIFFFFFNILHKFHF